MDGVARPRRLRQRSIYRHDQFFNGFGPGSGRQLAAAFFCCCPRFDAQRASFWPGRYAA